MTESFVRIERGEGHSSHRRGLQPIVIRDSSHSTYHGREVHVVRDPGHSSSRVFRNAVDSALPECST